MKRIVLITVLSIAALMLAACDTGDTRRDDTAAQQLQPNIQNYERSNADSLVDAITRIGAGAALTGGPAGAPAAAAVTQADRVIECFQNVGAVDASLYVEQGTSDVVPNAGASVVINETRVQRNLINCLTTATGGDDEFSAQSLDIRPCAASGRFDYQGESFVYLYVGVGSEICNSFFTHFENFNPTPIEFPTASS